MPVRQIADYDSIAWFYNRYLKGRYHRRALAVLQRILLAELPKKARILDVCCGAGHLTQALAEQGFRMTGMDLSVEMIEYALQNVPKGHFFVADARAFHLAPRFHAAISTFDSLNHILSRRDLARVFQNVWNALLAGGTFVFDLNTEEAYLTEWRKSSAIVKDNHAVFIRGGYDAHERMGRTLITIFKRSGEWQRSEALFWQRFHPLNEVERALKRVGFTEVRCYQAKEDLGMSGDLGTGRAFVRAMKNC